MRESADACPGTFLATFEPHNVAFRDDQRGDFFLNVSQLLPLEEDYKNYTLIIQFEFLEFTGSEIV